MSGTEEQPPPQQPEAGSPEAGAPEAGAPEARAPEARAPEARAPEAEPPGADALGAAHEALARARVQARSRGLRPGMADRKRTGGESLAQRRSGTGDGAARDPRLLNAEMDRLVASRGWSADVQVGAVIGRWPTIVGNEVAAHVLPLGFDGTVLTVQADSTAWATQMRLLTHSVLTRIEAEVGAGVVTEITVRGPAAPSWRKGRFRAQGPGPRDTYG